MADEHVILFIHIPTPVAVLHTQSRIGTSGIHQGIGGRFHRNIACLRNSKNIKKSEQWNKRKLALVTPYWADHAGTMGGGTSN